MKEIKRIYWSYFPGKFVNRNTGKEMVLANGTHIAFQGNVREWYETLLETIQSVILVPKNNIKLYVSDKAETIIRSLVNFQPTKKKSKNIGLLTTTTNSIPVHVKNKIVNFLNADIVVVNKDDSNYCSIVFVK